MHEQLTTANNNNEHVAPNKYSEAELLHQTCEIQKV